MLPSLPVQVSASVVTFSFWLPLGRTISGWTHNVARSAHLGLNHGCNSKRSVVSSIRGISVVFTPFAKLTSVKNFKFSYIHKACHQILRPDDILCFLRCTTQWPSASFRDSLVLQLTAHATLLYSLSVLLLSACHQALSSKCYAYEWPRGNPVLAVICDEREQERRDKKLRGRKINIKGFEG